MDGQERPVLRAGEAVLAKCPSESEITDLGRVGCEVSASRDGSDHRLSTWGLHLTWRIESSLQVVHCNPRERSDLERPVPHWSSAFAESETGALHDLLWIHDVGAGVPVTGRT